MDVNSIICGDNVETLKTFPDASIDLVVTSPPYDNLRKYGGHSWDFEGIAKELTRVIKRGGVIVWVVSDATHKGSESLTSMRQAIYLKDVCGLNVHDTMIYSTHKMPLTHNRYEQMWEYMFVFSKGKPRSFNPIMEKCKRAGQITTSTRRHNLHDLERTHGYGKPTKKQKIKGNIWHYESGFNKTTTDAIAYNHQAVFPEALARDHILSWSNEGDIVLDPFNGSGTTTKMAHMLGRRFIGIDVHRPYCEIANIRTNVMLSTR